MRKPLLARYAVEGHDAAKLVVKRAQGPSHSFVQADGLQHSGGRLRIGEVKELPEIRAEAS